MGATIVTGAGSPFIQPRDTERGDFQMFDSMAPPMHDKLTSTPTLAQPNPLSRASMYLYTKSDVRDVEVDGHDGAEHNQAADGVLQKGNAAAPIGVGAAAAGIDQGHACVKGYRDGHLDNGARGVLD